MSQSGLEVYPRVGAQGWGWEKGYEYLCQLHCQDPGGQREHAWAGLRSTPTRSLDEKMGSGVQWWGAMDTWRKSTQPRLGEQRLPGGLEASQRQAEKVLHRENGLFTERSEKSWRGGWEPGCVVCVEGGRFVKLGRGKHHFSALEGGRSSESRLSLLHGTSRNLNKPSLSISPSLLAKWGQYSKDANIIGLY